MSELLSQRQFAERIGRSNVWVSKLVKQGKLPVINGKIPLDQGIIAYEASQRLGYDNNREYNEQQRQKNGKQNPVKPARPVEPATLPDDDEPLPSTGSISVDKVAAAFNKARLAEKTYQAKLKELDYKEKQGHLLPKEAVEADAAAVAEELRGLLFAISPRIAPLCEGKPARQIEAIIEEAINDALAALKKSRFVG